MAQGGLVNHYQRGGGPSYNEMTDEEWHEYRKHHPAAEILLPLSRPYNPELPEDDPGNQRARRGEEPGQLRGRGYGEKIIEYPVTPSQIPLPRPRPYNPHLSQDEPGNQRVIDSYFRMDPFFQMLRSDEFGKWLDQQERGRAQGGLVDLPGYYQRGGLGGMRLGARMPHNYPSFRRSPMPGMGRSPGVHLINSSVPGRTDRIPMRARTGSYILPADVVSGLGQGNTYAGAKMWGQAIAHSAGPAGSTIHPIRAARFQPPRLRMRQAAGFARGGADDDGGYTPIITAGGECVVDPEMVVALGRGDAERGKRCLNDSVMSVRKHVIAHMKRLPPPVK